MRRTYWGLAATATVGGVLVALPATAAAPVRTVATPKIALPAPGGVTLARFTVRIPILAGAKAPPLRIRLGNRAKLPKQLIVAGGVARPTRAGRFAVYRSVVVLARSKATRSFAASSARAENDDALLLILAALALDRDGNSVAAKIIEQRFERLSAGANATSVKGACARTGAAKVIGDLTKLGALTDWLREDAPLANGWESAQDVVGAVCKPAAPAQPLAAIMAEIEKELDAAYERAAPVAGGCTGSYRSPPQTLSTPTSGEQDYVFKTPISSSCDVKTATKIIDHAELVDAASGKVLAQSSDIEPDTAGVLGAGVGVDAPYPVLEGSKWSYWVRVSRQSKNAVPVSVSAYLRVSWCPGATPAKCKPG